MSRKTKAKPPSGVCNWHRWNDNGVYETCSARATVRRGQRCYCFDHDPRRIKAQRRKRRSQIRRQQRAAVAQKRNLAVQARVNVAINAEAKKATSCLLMYLHSNTDLDREATLAEAFRHSVVCEELSHDLTTLREEYARI